MKIITQRRYFPAPAGETQFGFWTAWVELNDARAGRVFEGSTRSEAIGNCVLGTTHIVGVAGVLAIVERDAAAAEKGGHRAHS